MFCTENACHPACTNWYMSGGQVLNCRLSQLFNTALVVVTRCVCAVPKPHEDMLAPGHNNQKHPSGCTCQLRL